MEIIARVGDTRDTKRILVGNLNRRETASETAADMCGWKSGRERSKFC